ncbi:MAG: phosphoenolpyruvate synthase, partial [Archaeoglobaceae archaeon]|nr:phosphoenolpyruvate synthase [Archaeoglobaceae archaeon]
MPVLWLSDLSRNDISVVGGKAANLGELLRIEIPVPEGFVVDARAFRDFINRTNLRNIIYEHLRNLDVEKTEELNRVSQEIRKMISEAKMPEEIEKVIKKAYRELGNGDEVYVAVRSSATAEDLPDASFAGQQDTYLNVKGEDEVVKKVKECWGSLFTPRAIYYRAHKGFKHEDVSIAVIVQKMVNSEKSGVMFTSHPVTGEKKCVIEAVFGLGEAIVGGLVTPDTYVYDRVGKKITEVKVSEKKFMIVRKNGNEKVELGKRGKERVLTDEEIKKLVDIGEIIEEHYGKPQDVEWAIEKDKIFIVQSRPITTIKETKEEIPQKKGEEILLKGLGASPGIATGMVKIVSSDKDISKVKDGDVLVAVMTTPDMVPAMKKASAIVTDEGGLTCHAAIVSRELGVPAVVGTKNATKVLKDQMIVTVDGEKGVVYLGELEVCKREELKSVPISAPIITATEVKVNISLPDAAEKVARETNADGVGLFRIEHMVLS